MLGRPGRVVALSVGFVLAVAALVGCDVGPVVLEGTLTHAVTGEPLVGVPVRVYSSSEATVVARAHTGDDGSYRFRSGSLAEGTYRVEFSVGHWWEDAAGWETARDVSVSVGSPLRLDAALVPEMTTVWGHTLSRDSAQTGVRVDAFFADTGGLAATTVSELCGSSPVGDPCFELELPAGGRYTFRASQDESTTVEWQGFTNGAWGIELAPGQQQIPDFNLHDAGSVHGRVVDGDGIPLGGARVVAIPTGEPVPPKALEDTTAADGTFAIAGFDSNAAPVSFYLLLARPDGTGTLAGVVDGDPETATEFVIAGPTLDVGDVTLAGNLTGATRVALGNEYSCAVVAGGDVRCWGDNRVGQLGDGTIEGRLTPAAPLGLSGVTDIAAGWNHVCAVVGGEVRCWGSNGSGQLGDGTRQTRLTPVAVPGLSGVTDIAAGSAHTCALVASGEVRCWGHLTAEFPGDLTSDQLTPVAVPGLSGVTEIGAGGGHTCAVVAGGELRCWGINIFGQLGDGTTQGRSTPVAVAGLSGVTDFVADWFHSCAVVAGGEVRCWGDNSSGQLGDGTTVNRLTPVAVRGLSGVTEIDAAGNYICAVVAGGEARCWGSNRVGGLGDGTTVNRLTPVAVVGLSGATDIDAGNSHSCVVAAGGQIRCWGFNESGQLGDGTTEIRLTPVAVINP